VVDPARGRRLHAGITLDEDFFYHPAPRVEAGRRMEQVLYERLGNRADRRAGVVLVQAFFAADSRAHADDCSSLL